MTALARRSKQVMKSLVRKMPLRTAGDHWSDRYAAEGLEAPATYWLGLERVRSRYNSKATGGFSNDSWVSYASSFLPCRSSGPVRVLSLGCGAGDLEHDLLARDAFDECDAHDLSEEGLRVARGRTPEADRERLRYFRSDLNEIELPANHYEAVFFNMSLHHVEALDRICSEVHRALTANGVLIVHEYVGADRFGFPPRQALALERTNALVPDRFRRLSNGIVRTAAPIPDPKAVIELDPSEAVHSSQIVGVLTEHFNVVVHHEIGGGLLQFLLNDIAANFGDDAESVAVLEMLFAIEDGLMAAHELPNDFALMVFRRRVESVVEHGDVGLTT
jgi:SAM-dependent methyltransferase